MGRHDALLHLAETCYVRYKELLSTTPYKDLDENQRAHRMIALAAVFQEGLDLEFCPTEFQNDKGIVLVACSQNGWAIKFASQRLRNDKEIVVVACSKNGMSLAAYASLRLQNGKEFGLRIDDDISKKVAEEYTASRSNRTEASTSTSTRAPLVGKRVQKTPEASKNQFLTQAECKGLCLLYGMKTRAITRRNEDIFTDICIHCSKCDPAIILKTYPQYRNNIKAVLAACSRNGTSLRYASDELRNNKEVVMKACSQTWHALQYASTRLRNDKEVVSVALSKQTFDLQKVAWLQDNKEAVLVACIEDGMALRFASETLRGDKDVVLAAAGSKPESIKYALGGLNQDKECLIKAGLWDENYNQKERKIVERKIVLSTKFSLAPKSSPHATKFTVEMKNHPFVSSGNFRVYSGIFPKCI